MSYSKKTWVTGETVKAEYLNNMENGIEDNSTDIASEIKRATQAEESIRDSIPTKTSDLSNDSGYKTTDTNTTYTLTKEGDQIVLKGSDGSKSNVLDNSGINDLSNYYTKSETYDKGTIDSKLNNKANLSDLNTITDTFITKAEVVENYFDKDNTYDKGTIDQKIASASSGGTIDLSNYVDKTSQQQITGNKTFTGNFTIGGTLCDKQASQGTAGQILSSTGDGIEWINAPSGGNSENSEYAEKLGTPEEYLKIGEISDAETGETYPAPILISNDTEIVVATEHILSKFTTLMQQMFSGEIDSKLASELDNYYDKTNTELQITSRLANYYKKSETYSQEEIDTKHNALVNKTGAQEISGEKNFCGKVSFYDVINDKDDSVGTAGQILSSTGDGVKWVDAPNGGSGSDPDVSNLEARINELEDFTTYAENNYAYKTDVEDLIDEKIAEISDDTSYVYEPITSEITLEAVDSMDCKPLYIKIEGTIPNGDKVLLGTLHGEYDIYLWSDNRVEVVSVMDLRQATTIETGILEIKFDALTDGGTIQPNWSNQAYFVDRVKEINIPVGKNYAYTAILERADIEIDVNKVYTLNAINWDYQLMPNFILTDNGNPLELDKVYTLKVLNFLMPQYTNEETIDIAALFRMKLEGGLTESGTGEGRTFAWSDENGEAMGVGYCHLDSGFDISGVVEITFWTDDTASCYVLLSPFATSEW